MNSSNWRERMVSDLVVAGMDERTQEAYLRAVRLELLSEVVFC